MEDTVENAAKDTGATVNIVSIVDAISAAPNTHF